MITVSPVEPLPEEERTFLDRQTILIRLDDYVSLKQAEQTVSNIKQFMEQGKESAYMDKEDLRLLLGIIGGNK